MIELVIVIVVIGVLAAVMLPRFFDVGRDARIANVQALAGAVRTAAEVARMKWVVSGNNDMGSVALALDSGQQVYFYRGWPDAGNCCNPSGLQDLVDASGFTVTGLGNTVTQFAPVSAIDSATCSVRYTEAINPGDRYTLTVTTSGC